jgi:dolichyl-phosphate-mannose-protein mannosyltransferase
MYPEGSKQQQVTTYHHRDDNNVFIVRRAFDQGVTYVKKQEDERDALNILKNGDRIRLEHAATGRFIHSHNVPAPLSDKDHHYEISGYGHNPQNFSDTNDNWRIEIVDSYGNPVAKRDKEPIKAIKMNIRLVHANINCALSAHNKPLPDWGFKQGEVACGRETLKTDSIWTIETNYHPLEKADAPRVQFPKASFWSRFVELNIKMWVTNKHLAGEHPFGSRPSSWPILTRGLGFWNGNHVPRTEKAYKKDKDAKNLPPQHQLPAEAEDEADKLEASRLKTLYENKFKHSQIYLIGNPILWWTTTAFIVLYVIGVFSNRFLTKISPRYPGLASSRIYTLLSTFYVSSNPSGFLFMSWLLHWLPFFGMHRQLFLHHYLPALFFGIILTAIQFECLSTQFLGERKKRTILILLTGFGIAAFFAFAPLGYGLRLSKKHCLRLKWLPRWDFDCDSIVG